MRSSVYDSEFHVHKEIQDGFNGEIRGELRDDLRQNRPIEGKVVISNNAEYSQDAPEPESEEKWEPVPQELMYREMVSYPQYNADPLDFLTPSEAADLPDLDFPVPDQNVIPEMVFENDDMSSQGQQQSQHRSPQSAAPPHHLHPSHSPLIPIQSSLVAHARTGKMSLAAVQERRTKNTEAARRSRARRADKITELRQEKAELLAENTKLVGENRRLLKLVETLESKLTLRSDPPTYN